MPKAKTTRLCKSRSERVRVPVLILVGSQDEATPPLMSRELASLLPDARLNVLDGCAHVPQLQDPAGFLAAVNAFLSV